jgi:hypothetical protein
MTESAPPLFEDGGHIEQSSELQKSRKGEKAPNVL